MKKNIKFIIMGLVIVGGMNIIGCESKQDDYVKDINNLYIDAYINEEIKKNEENMPKNMEEYNISNKDLQHFYDVGYNSVLETGLSSNTDANNPHSLAILIKNVVVRTYNQSEFTSECAESLINGTVDALELENVLFYDGNGEPLDTNTMKNLTIEYFNTIFYNLF